MLEGIRIKDANLLGAKQLHNNSFEMENFIHFPKITKYRFGFGKIFVETRDSICDSELKKSARKLENCTFVSFELKKEQRMRTQFIGNQLHL